ncbi:glycosyltransferase family 2 protein [Flavobacterium panacagri]|uniref:glycosyltransferase family 2 protein n=1 Tax=Flavobacterium panacagri TaxID=3034146 RepID=UPI0025A5A6FA|nr:glycosyltransferase family A protein [Flavobacterium panacagri]
MNFSLSVIIPVYNCEQFIEKAILSILLQKEVSEIVVVNDGSTDASLQILQKLEKEYPIVKLYHHTGQSNQGRSASRNLGIQKATGNFIAFLDADDYYLENRFLNDKKMFGLDSNCDGVYNAVGFHFYREATAYELEKHQIYTVTEKVKPEFLFKTLLYGKSGHFHINGLTVKKSVFDLTGLFNTDLVVAEDTDIFWKMAIKCRLETGIIDKPLAIRGVHDSNVFDQQDLYSEYTIKMFRTLAIWCSHNNVEFAIVDDLFKWIWLLKFKQNNSIIEDTFYWAKMTFSNPKFLFSILTIKYFPLVRRRKELFSFLYKSRKITLENES